jgi:predicted nucleic acid-binding protein
MAITHLLDTSVYSQPLKLTPHPGVVARWQALGDARLAISVITEAEVRYGLALKGSAKLEAAYERILRGRLPVLPVDEAVGTAFARLKATQHQLGKRVPDLDLLIAATAQVHQLVVVTLNVKHFELIAGIRLEEWG